MKKINKILVILSIILSIIYTIPIINSQNIYNILIRLSLILVVLIPYILKYFKINLSQASIFVYLIFVLLAHFLGSVVELYNKVYWFDTFCHFLSGQVVSVFALEFINKKNEKTNIIVQILFILGMSALVAVCWETFEFINDNLFDKDAQKVITTGVTDTMKDMIVALLGSGLFCLSYLFEYINQKKYLIYKFIIEG
jgi:hypothetical protein